MLYTFFIIFTLCLVGPPKSPSVDVYGQVGNAWRIPRGTDAYHTSTDASLFSSSLPVFPREKCI